MRLRSLLYVPANAERFLAKATTRGADALILDLEDSVPLGEKAKARDGLAHWIPKLSRDVPVFVRLNAQEAPYTEILAEAVLAARAGAKGLVVPKVESPMQITAISTAIAQAGLPRLPILALIEGPVGLLSVSAIASAADVMGLALGGEDFALAIGAEPLPEVLTPPKLMVHYAAKANGLLSFGLLRSVADFTDIKAIKAAARQARSHGFDGATCIHPDIVPILNESFSPDAEAVMQAKGIVAAMDAALAQGSGAAVYMGHMIDAPVLARARKILSDQDTG